MEQKQYQLHARAGLSIALEDVQTLLALSDGDCALLYLYLLRSGGFLNAAAAARELGRTESAVNAAAEKLRGAGLLGETKAVAAPAEELPEYDSLDLLRRSREDKSFQALVAEAQARLGHALSSADLRCLFGLYDHLGLPCEVILLIINRCAAVAKERYGEGRLPTMRAIEKEAYVWFNREILTLEQAEEYLAFLHARDGRARSLSALLQLEGRRLTPTERKYMESWLAMGFPEETLELAYDRTMVGTGGKFVWKYMDAILRAWQEKGLRTVAEVEAGDTRGAPRRRSTPSAAGNERVWQGDDLDTLERMLKGD